MIWILRHGEAEDGAGKPDFERELTKKGRDQASDAGKAMKRLGEKLDVCLSSPATRALDTAKLACRQLGVEVEEDSRIWDGDWDALELAAGRGEVMIVGHQPDCSQAIALATGSRVKMKKGGLAALDDHVLHVLYRPDDLSAVAGS